MRNFVLLSFLFIFSCTPQAKRDMTQHEQNTALIEQYFTAFNNHDWDNMASLYTDEAAFKDPSLGPGIVTQTRKHIIQKYRELLDVFPDISDEVVQVYPSGDNHVIVEFISRGTAPDGSEFELPVCTIFTIENGQITKDFTYYDNFDE